MAFEQYGELLTELFHLFERGISDLFAILNPINYIDQVELQFFELCVDLVKTSRHGKFPRLRVVTSSSSERQ